MIATRLRWHWYAFKVLTYGVALQGVVMIAGALEDQLHVRLGHRGVHLSGYIFSVPILLGLSVLYVSLLLRRRKRTAWVAAMTMYGVILLVNMWQLTILREAHPLSMAAVLRNIVLPMLVLAGLVLVRGEFTVRSDVRSFAASLRFVVLILLVAFLYGVTGFMLMDRRDFHQEISLVDAMHRTVDQFGITTTDGVPHTRRAHLFVDSLKVMSFGALGYAALSLFQPIRARFADMTSQRERVRLLLERHHGNSEDFFKLWPTEDKFYFFNLSHTAGLAYGVRRGIALVVGDPIGDPLTFDRLLASFDEFCRINDWKPAFVHTEPKFAELYKQHGFTLQKLGEEAIVDIAHFESGVADQKYFRQIRNKFVREGYTTEMYAPPHNAALISRLHAISNLWLEKPGREERGFMLGYFSEEYMQLCNIMVLRDAAGTIQAFINQVPSFDPGEANYDLLRYTQDMLGNGNDYLLMEFIHYLHGHGNFKRINLGLCMLAGVGSAEEKTLIDNALRLLYAKGDRFFSFSGLHRFKAKYEPEWSSRYIAYRGGISGFTRTAAALNKIAKV